MMSSVELFILLFTYATSAAPIDKGSAPTPTEHTSLQAGIYLDIGIITGIVVFTVIVLAVIGTADQWQNGTTAIQDTSCANCCNSCNSCTCEDLMKCCCEFLIECLANSCSLAFGL